MKNTLFLLLVCVLCTSCASYYGSAKIISHPAGAEVVDANNGHVLGVTPVETWWQDGSNKRKYVILRFKKNGFYEKTSGFWLSMRHSSLNKAKNSQQLFETSLEQRD